MMAKYTIRQVMLNNKSRKGWHYYVKEKGKPGRHYKVIKGKTNKFYLNKYKNPKKKAKPVKRIVKDKKTGVKIAGKIT